MKQTATTPAADHPEWADLPASPKEAKALGIPRYSTGQPCAKGHMSPRRTASGNCCACEREYAKTPKFVDYMRQYDKTQKRRDYNREYMRTQRRAAKLKPV